MSNMKKKVTAREFLHQFAKLEKQLRPGESLTVTRRGAPLGSFTKQPAPAIALPDFEQNATRHGFSARTGDQLLARILDDEAIS
jgi:hypothetical protein